MPGSAHMSAPAVSPIRTTSRAQSVPSRAVCAGLDVAGAELRRRSTPVLSGWACLFGGVYRVTGEEMVAST